MVLRPLESVAPAANRCESQLGIWMLYSVILDDLLPRVLRLPSKRIGPCHDLFTKNVNTTMEYFRWIQIRSDSVKRIGRIGKGMVIWS